MTSVGPASSDSGASLSASSSPASSSASLPPSSSPSGSTSASIVSVSPPPASSSSLPASSNVGLSSSFTPSSTPSSTTPPSSTILTAPSTTTSESTMIGTSDGQTFTTIIEITSIIPPGSTVSASTSTPPPTSHTGAIVGGVIGGLAFLTVVGGVIFWFHRRSRYRSEFDGNFDPARVTSTRPVSSGPEMIQHIGGGTLPRLDIDDEDDGMGGRLPHSTVGGGIVTPFAYTPTASAYGSTRSRSPPVSSGSPPPMSQYSQDGYAPTMSSAGGYYAAVPQQPQAVGGYYPPAPPSSTSSSGNQYNPRSAKEREAGRSGNFAVANPSTDPGDSRPMSGGYNDQYQAYLRSGPQARRGSQSEYNDPSSYPPLSPTASSSGASQRLGGVLVHQDGGRMEPETVHEEEADEIPPTYDSLPDEQRK
ncbi:hypothetical protein C8R45DRAFT_45037 [Mycena sanguinolenta]|nr:hypothetical protein C8R45DRAFT_45037 [Mycena sanguinolenta]